MAFNFNWSPLTADAEFYSKARDLLTTALNKSPKPPIIVDDILVSELNLGTVPPDLEILEIGDLAEDRFRGIFKMCYSGDAYLTLKTKVQANPLNTYLYSKPSFTSPQPLAAASGLTIPLSITLSDIKLSAFIILVFSKQKGLTLVFRNDPLESLKVSSTFDSIQFVRDYLQRTIEQQLRNLMMDELPAIIHRLSLQMWCPEQASKGLDERPVPEQTVAEDEERVNPFASPPQDPVDASGNLLDHNDISELTLTGGGESQSLFSQKNLLRLAALTDSHRTLSLFTPGINDVVFRAWSGHGNRSDANSPAAGMPSLTRTLSLPAGNSTTYTFSDSGSSVHGHLPSRPSLVSLNSATTGLALGAGNRSRPGRKRKTRVVNLRRSKSELGHSEDGSDTVSIDAPLSEPLVAPSIPEESEADVALSDIVTGKVHFNEDGLTPGLSTRPKETPDLASLAQVMESSQETVKVPRPAQRPSLETLISQHKYEQASSGSETSSVILEQAWIMKMAGEIARRVYDEKNQRDGGSVWEEQSEAPPTYEAAIH